MVMKSRERDVSAKRHQKMAPMTIVSRMLLLQTEKGHWKKPSSPFTVDTKDTGLSRGIDDRAGYSVD